jgi:Lon protease-like protein
LELNVISAAMFPLGSVLFPHALLPLHVFEPRYRVMMRHCLEGDKEFGVVLIERGSEVGGGDVRFDVGTLARIVQANELPDGRWSVACVGVQRLLVEEWLPDDPFPRARVELLREPTVGPDAYAACDAVRTALADVLQLWHQLDERVPTEVPEVADDPTRGLFELAALAPIGPLDAQAVLAAPDVPARGALLIELLADRAREIRARLR